MFKTDSRDKKKYLTMFAALLALLMPIYLSMGSNPKMKLSESRKAIEANERGRGAGLRAATKSVSSGVAPSLEMKENVDFMLTPALLVQEALSDDIVITYPSE